MSDPSIISPVGYSNSTCGYCSAPGKRSSAKSSASYGFWAHQLSVKFYDYLMNRGWRRSGQYVYHPDIARTCCPQMTIRLEAERFQPGRHQRKVQTKFTRFVLTGSEEHPPGRKPGKGKHNKPFVLLDSLAEIEQPSPPTLSSSSSSSKPHTFHTSLHPSSPSHPAVHPLYVKYQTRIHGDSSTSSSITLPSFKRFLCTSPLIDSPIQYSDDILPSTLTTAERKKKLAERGLPESYGSWHLLYWLDGQVVAFSVLDVVPSGVSSVYFCYDPDLDSQGWGKLSALREIGLSQKMVQAGAADCKFVYLGYYIQSCQKMRYKGEYKPADLLDPETNVYHLLAPLIPYLKAQPQGYFPFASPPPLPSTSSSTPTETEPSPALPAPSSDEWSEDDEPELSLPTSPPPPSFLATTEVTNKALGDVLTLANGNECRRFKDSRYRRDQEVVTSLKELVASLHGPTGTGEKGVLTGELSELGLVVVAVR